MKRVATFIFSRVRVGFVILLTVQGIDDRSRLSNSERARFNKKVERGSPGGPARSKQCRDKGNRGRRGGLPSSSQEASLVSSFLCFIGNILIVPFLAENAIFLQKLLLFALNQHHDRHGSSPVN